MGRIDRTPSYLSSLSSLSLITLDHRESCRTLFRLAPNLETVALKIYTMPPGISPIDVQVQRTEVIDA